MNNPKKYNMARRERPEKSNVTHKTVWEKRTRKSRGGVKHDRYVPVKVKI